MDGHRGRRKKSQSGLTLTSSDPNSSWQITFEELVFDQLLVLLNSRLLLRHHWHDLKRAGSRRNVRIYWRKYFLSLHFGIARWIGERSKSSPSPHVQMEDKTGDGGGGICGEEESERREKFIIKLRLIDCSSFLWKRYIWGIRMEWKSRFLSFVNRVKGFWRERIGKLVASMILDRFEIRDRLHGSIFVDCHILVDWRHAAERAFVKAYASGCFERAFPVERFFVKKFEDFWALFLLSKFCLLFKLELFHQNIHANPTPFRFCFYDPSKVT